MLSWVLTMSLCICIHVCRMPFCVKMAEQIELVHFWYRGFPWPMQHYILSNLGISKSKGLLFGIFP